MYTNVELAVGISMGELRLAVSKFQFGTQDCDFRTTAKDICDVYLISVAQSMGPPLAGPHHLISLENELEVSMLRSHPPYLLAKRELLTALPKAIVSHDSCSESWA
jgi:hypothetical protein